MHILYHGSGYHQEELKPGIHYTGVKVEWDKTESNEWLYASSVMEEAIAQGFCSVVEKTFQLCRFQSHGSELVFIFDGKLPSLEDLSKLDVFLYNIRNLPEHKWVKVNNLHNGMDNEFKTTSIIEKHAIIKSDQIDLKKWLSRKKVSIKHKKSAMNW